MPVTGHFRGAMRRLSGSADKLGGSSYLRTKQFVEWRSALAEKCARAPPVFFWQTVKPLSWPSSCAGAQHVGLLQGQ